MTGKETTPNARKLTLLELDGYCTHDVVQRNSENCALSQNVNMCHITNRDYPHMLLNSGDSLVISTNISLQGLVRQLEHQNLSYMCHPIQCRRNSSPVLLACPSVWLNPTLSRNKMYDLPKDSICRQTICNTRSGREMSHELQPCHTRIALN